MENEFCEIADSGDALTELNYLSAIRNKSPIDTVREYIALDRQVTEKLYKDQFKDDENAFNDALQSYKSANDLKRKELFEEATVKENMALERKIADEFFELSSACPEVDSFEKIPKAVLEKAKETSLLDAYLRFFHDEQMKIKKNNDARKQNLRAAAGELNSGGESVDSLLSAFIKGLNS